MAQKLFNRIEASKVGKIETFPHSNVDSDLYLICDGSEISRSEFDKLFSVIGTLYGNGDGVSTFNLPDYRGFFLRGADHSAGIDPDGATRLLGEPQLDSFASHRHLGAYYLHNWRGGGSSGGDGKYNSNSRQWTAYKGGDETRPTNITVNFYIRSRAV